MILIFCICFIEISSYSGNRTSLTFPKREFRFVTSNHLRPRKAKAYENPNVIYITRAQKCFFFLFFLSTSVSSYTLLLAQYTAPFYHSSFSPFFPTFLPFLHSFPSCPFPSVSFSFFAFFLPGKFEHFCELPSSTAIMLLHFLESCILHLLRFSIDDNFVYLYTREHEEAV